jgi:hypothetical protein
VAYQEGLSLTKLVTQVTEARRGERTAPGKCKGLGTGGKGPLKGEENLKKKKQ